MQLDPAQRRLPRPELAPLMTPETGDSLRLSDGRALGYVELGDEAGYPVLFFHGGLSSRLEAGLYAAAAAEQGLRLIGLDRPGMGLSDPSSATGFRAWATDVGEVAAQLGIDRFSVTGSSGAGGYICACGLTATLAGHIDLLAPLCGMLPATPGERAEQSAAVRTSLALAARYPRLASAAFWCMKPLMARAAASGRMTSAPGASAEEFRQAQQMGGAARIMALGSVAGMTRGIRGSVDDLAIYDQPLDFELSDIRVPVLAFHGSDDVNVPISVARRLVASVPEGELVSYEGLAHHFMLIKADEIIERIADRLRTIGAL